MTLQFVDAEDLNKVESDPNRDIPNKRFVKTPMGRDITLERKDPYGFIYITWYNGPTPDELRGSFTNFELARSAVETYINNNLVDKPQNELPPFRYKKKYRETN